MSSIDSSPFNALPYITSFVEVISFVLLFSLEVILSLFVLLSYSEVILSLFILLHSNEGILFPFDKNAKGVNDYLLFILQPLFLQFMPINLQL